MRLTSLVKSGGCAAKLGPDVLSAAAHGLAEAAADPRLIVGFEWADDAGVIALDADRALVQTVDFFTPIIDDPFTFGAISATNALSDVYAMGGEPLTAVNIVGFPADLDPMILRAILQGGLAKLKEAGAVLAGGHSVKDPELKYGLAVTGLVHPERIWRNQGALPGDVLVLTKSLGTGILTTARKRDAIPESALSQAIASMLRLNRDAKRAAEGLSVRACTDVTGNGLAGHSYEMARASGVTLNFRFSALPLLDGALDLAHEHCPGGAQNNARYVGDALDTSALSDQQRALILDPQTSGGLLFSLASNEVETFQYRCSERQVTATIVGSVHTGPVGVRVSA